MEASGHCEKDTRQNHQAHVAYNEIPPAKAMEMLHIMAHKPGQTWIKRMSSVLCCFCLRACEQPLELQI